MAKRSGILIGTAGVYHVASQLAQQGFHAAVTFGNAPSVDILVASPNGSSTISLQIKTSHWALRTRGRGSKKQPHHYEWDVGQKSAYLNQTDLFFAFVDLKLGKCELPEVFIVPSQRVFDAFDKPYFKSGTSRSWRWHPGLKEIEEYKTAWATLHNRLNKTDN